MRGNCRQSVNILMSEDKYFRHQVALTCADCNAGGRELAILVQAGRRIKQRMQQACKAMYTVAKLQTVIKDTQGVHGYNAA